MTMRILRRPALAAAAAVLVLITGTGCVRYDSAKGAADEAALIDTGNRELDALTLPPGWILQTREARPGSGGILDWNRTYTVPLDADSAVARYGELLVAAGWIEGHDCMVSNKAQCSTYEKPGFRISPLIPSPCSELPPSCTYLDVRMYRTFSKRG